MVTNLYTTKLHPEKAENLSPEIKSAIVELQRAFPEQKIEAISWNKHYVAIPIEVDVDLPTRGPVGNLDIREREPIYLLINRQDYPYKVPLAYSNRKDFPKDLLPHLNPRPPGSAASFCLHRGCLDDWFAEHTVIHLVKRVQGWLRDASSDRLIHREDGFEPTRLDEVIGYGIYEPSILTDLVYQKWILDDGNAGFAFLWYKLLNNPSKEPLVGRDTYAIQLAYPVHVEIIDEALELSRMINDINISETKLERRLFGLFAWPPEEYVYEKYLTELPNTLGSFQKWSESLGIPLNKALKNYLSKNLLLLGGVPVTLAIRRPQNLIGTKSPIELLNFVIAVNDEHLPKDGKWNLDTKVRSMGHRTPLTLHRAREISSQPVDLDFGRLLFLGCGVVGSKLILHLARSGQGNMTLIDYDELSPHNLVRHGLLHGSLGMNKAEALKDVINGMFYADDTKKIDIIKESALGIFCGEQKDVLNQHDWLIDTTASSMMLNVLCRVDLPEMLSCCRCEIAYKGRIGFLYVEGSSRNPRMDDLQALIFDMAIEDSTLSHWLQSNQEQRTSVGSRFEEINIGISCSSETMRLSDDTASLHAASFTAGFRKIVKERINNSFGRIQISRCGEEGSVTTVVEQFEIPPTIVIKSQNDSSWQVRLSYNSKLKLRRLFLSAGSNETGGLLIGMVNHKRKIVYVTRVLPAPPDSESYPWAFVRGIKDIPDVISDIEVLSGGMLGYVGEWHTHPIGEPNLSEKDMNAVKKIKKNLDKTSIPTHVMIVTSNGLYSYIFSPM